MDLPILLPHCVFAEMIGCLGLSDLRTVPLVCKAWLAAEREHREFLWRQFSPGWPSLHKHVALRTWLFEKHRRSLVCADEFALESPRTQAPPLSTAAWACIAPTVLRRRLPLYGFASSMLDTLAPRRFKVTITGPRYSGTTSVLNACCDRPIFHAERTGPLHVETIMSGGAVVQLWDTSADRAVGKIGSYGDAQARGCFEGTDGLIYVCDGQSSAEDARVFEDVLRMPEMREGAPLLVLASKQDLVQRAPAQTVLSLGLLAYPRTRWRAQPCSLVGWGKTTRLERAEVAKGLAWLVGAMRDQER